MLRRSLFCGLTLGLTAALSAPAVAAQPSDAAPDAAQIHHVNFTKWTRTPDFAHGAKHGVKPAHGMLTIADPVGTHDYTDPYGDGQAKTYDYATWVSPVVDPDFDVYELIASWNAQTPPGTWIQVSMHGTTETGVHTKWYVMGRWSAKDPDAGGAIYRTSVPSQGDENGYVAIDTFYSLNGHSLDSYQIKVTLNRLPGTHASPKVDMVGAMASHVVTPDHVPASPLGGAEGITLDVPTYSQEIHSGEYPQWDGGGEAWCSPTSTSMVVAYWDRGPTPEDYSWVNPDYADPWVDYAARNTYDYNYDGAGNWPFNAAYAGQFGLEAYVTQLSSLTEAEQYIKAGIPVVVSVDWDDPSQLPTAGYVPSGHLMVIVGFTDDGDVVVNDPASHLIPSDGAVRTVYDREHFENVWIPVTGGIAYIIHPADVPLP